MILHMLTLLGGCAHETILVLPECVSSGDTKVRAGEDAPILGFSAEEVASGASGDMPVRVAGDFEDTYTWIFDPAGPAELRELTGEAVAVAGGSTCPPGPMLVAPVNVRMQSALGLDVRGDGVLHATTASLWLRGLFTMDAQEVPSAYAERLILCEHLTLGPSMGGFDPSIAWDVALGGASGGCSEASVIDWVRVP